MPLTLSVQEFDVGCVNSEVIVCTIQTLDCAITPLRAEPELDDETHLLRLANDPCYFWTLWSAFKKKIYRYCRYRLRTSHHDAEDLCSETMLKAYEKLHAVEPSVNILGWLLRICRNTHYDILRRNSTHSKYQEEVVEDKTIEEISAFFHREKSIATLHYIKRVIQELPERVSAICKAYFFEEKTYRELSQEYGCSESHIRKQIFKTRRYLMPACHRYMNDG